MSHARSAKRGWIAVTAAGVVLASGSLLSQAQPSAPLPQPIATPQAVLTRYCVSCHNERLKTGGFRLDNVNAADAASDPELWEKVVRKLRAGTMPPEGAPRPDRTTYEELRTWIAGQLDGAAAARPDPGRTEALHRLNRAEYANAVRDLLGLEALDIGLLLPGDDSSYGFDNIGGVLGISPTHLERYLAAARTIGRLAIGDPTLLPIAEEYAAPVALTQNDRFDELPFGTRGGMLIRRHFPVDAEYLLRFQTGRGLGTSATEPQQVEVAVDGRRVALIPLSEVPARRDAEGGRSRVDHQLRLPIRAGVREVAVTFLKTTNAEVEHLLQPFERNETVVLTQGGDSLSGPSLHRVSIVGPYNAAGATDTPSRRRIFVCRPTTAAEEGPCARRILSTLGRRAYRRPVTEREVDSLVSHYEAGRSGKTFDDGIRQGLERLLSSPEFLFRVESVPPRAAASSTYRINDLELASRLSFFLWSTIPDDELLDLAAKGRLGDPGVLERQTKRMLADSKSTLVSGFFSQWLKLRALQDVAFDLNLFPDFDDNLRNALRRETELFTASIVEEDRSVLDLLRGNHTFVNDRLARHYGIPNVYGSQFRRIVLEDPRRHGLLGKGSILTVTSLPNRTSPVARGKFVLEALLGAPPPPPPPDVPGLEENTAEGRPRSMREAMVRHRANPVCAACHKVMDPIGFALENFDAAGAWRSYDADVPIDASGVLPDGSKFDGVVELRSAFLARPENFVSTVTEKLLTYALGRGLEYYDMPAVRTIIRDAAPGDYRFSDIVLGVVRSVPFQMRRSRS
jgi:hypothetical protein